MPADTLRAKRMSKHRILLVVRWPVGGIRTFFRYVYRNFDSRKYIFTLITPELPEAKVLIEDLSGLHLKYVPTQARPSTREFVRAVTPVIREGDFDLIHSHGFTSAVCSIPGSLFKRIPHLLTSHDAFTEGQFTGLKGPVKRLALGLLFMMLDGIHCVSHDARENLLAHLKMLKLFEARVTAIPNGIEVDRFLRAGRRDLRRELGLPSDTFLIGFLGRFMSQKGFRYLIEALQLVLKRTDQSRQPVLLTFAEEDGFIREEKADVERRGLSGQVFFLPFVPNVASTLKGLDVVAIPSLWEACPLLPMEAMVAGVPLIGTDCVGLREVLTSTPATIVPARDSQALARAIIAEMRTPRVTIAADFVEHAAARFDVKRQAKQLEDWVLSYLEDSSRS
jgi:glycosyltransferase involved in cell wall biosynthesis